jgi:hypothetical protein
MGKEAEHGKISLGPGDGSAASNGFAYKINFSRLCDSALGRFQGQ